jgi:hypothetical protein
MRKKLAVFAAVLAFVVVACGWVVVRPGPYWTAYKSVQLGMTPEQIDELVPTPPESEGPLGPETFVIWEGLVEGQRHVIELTPVDFDEDVRPHPTLEKSLLVRNRGNEELDGDRGRELIRDRQTGRLVAIRWCRAREALIVFFDTEGKVAEKAYCQFRGEPMNLLKLWERVTRSWSAPPPGIGPAPVLQTAPVPAPRPNG